MTQTIHPSAVIGEGVVLGDGVTIGPNVVLLGPCVIGNDVWIGAGTIVGAPPEMSTHRHNSAWNGDLEHAGIRVGEGTTIRELCVIHQGTYRETTIGRGSWLLNRSYVAHDVQIGDEVTLSAGVSIGGHCMIDARVNIGMNAAVHQNRVIGAGAMIGMNTPLSRDVPPFAKVYGSPPRMGSLNIIGMSRAGIDDATIAALGLAYAEGDFNLGRAVGLAPLQAEIEWWRTNHTENMIARGVSA